MSPSPRFPAHGIATLAIALPWVNPFAPGPSPPVVQWLVTLVCVAVLLGLLALRQLEGRNFAQACVQGWLLAALVSSVLGVVQYFGASGALAPWVNITGLGEAFGNLRQRNQFATLTNMGLAALLWWEAQRPTDGEEVRNTDRATHPVSWMLMAALLGLGNASSSSRTGLVQLLLLGVGVAVWRYCATSPRNQAASRLTVRLMLVAVLAYGLALLLLPRLAGLDPAAHGLLARLAEGERACSSRLTLWRNVLHLIAQKPWLGWGWGELDYAHYITLYPGTRFCEILDNAHNLPLHLAVELGVPVALALCAAAIGLTLHARPWRETDPARRVAWAVLAVILLHSMLEYPLWYGPFLMAALLCLALLIWQPQSARPKNMPTGGKPGFVSVAATCVETILLAFVVFTAWDYHRVSQIFLPPAHRAAAYQTDTLAKIQRSWLFSNHVRYAELTTTPVTRGNAAEIYAAAQELLHFSPEARVIEKVIESAVQLGLDDEALAHMQRYRAAFPAEYARWTKPDTNEQEVVDE